MTSPNSLNLFTQCLDTVGDGSGSKDMAVDFSGGATSFKISADVGLLDCYLSNLKVIMLFTGQMGIDKYAKNLVLANGIQLRLTDQDDDLVEDFLDGNPVKSNAGWFFYAGKSNTFDAAASKTALVIDWSFVDKGFPLLLRPGWSLETILHDDFSSMDIHMMCVQGAHLRA